MNGGCGEVKMIGIVFKLGKIMQEGGIEDTSSEGKHSKISGH